MNKLTDPLLLNHRVRNRLYDVSSGYGSISVRDQMNRAFMVVTRALEAGIIDTKEKKLFVVGAGVAGVVAAMTAATRNVETVLIDVNERPFARMWFCDTRYVCPTQYDWPFDHWQEGLYPWKVPPVLPLTWNADFAGDVLTGWQTQFTLFLQKTQKLTFYPGSKFVAWRYAKQGGDWLVKITHAPISGGTEETGTFGMGLSCIGPGTEKCTVEYDSHKYTGLRFWDEDGFADPNVGLPSCDTPRVLISGGGDGSLQDALRVATQGMPAKEIYNLIEKRARTAIEAKLWTPERQETLEYLLAAPKVWQHEHNATRALHKAHQEVIEEIWADAAFSSQTFPQLRSALEPLISGRVKLTLVHPCDHFSHSYGLNRFLVLLASKYLVEQHGINILLPGQVVVKVEATDDCGCAQEGPPSPRDCLGKPHVVYCAQADCEALEVGTVNRSRLTPVGNEPHNVVIIRHGIKPSQTPFGRSPIRRHREMLPQWLS